MKFFMEDTTSAEVDNIMALLKSYMDGEISQQMRKSGLDYKLNFGVSMHWLRKIAAKYKNKQNLAERLWHREARETMILATMIANVSLLNSEKIKEWFAMVKTNELAEQFGVNLLSRSDNYKSLSQEFIHSDDVYKQAAGWCSLSIFLKNSELQNVASLVNDAFININQDYVFLQRTKGRFLRAACRHSRDLLDAIEAQLNLVKDDKKLAFLVQELRAEIDFMRES
ncbi:DNA alkylation repair protein [Saccharicrinis aurantiacus]|uniref:DNA alkylation repair protein n=1 Tax=Saccharicrinis aurantiacus TaxID=1849719 RepID=UPI0024933F38|nr:DNA alkylation repair protein [Saccharicrinis aurantiacus]